MLPGAQNLEFKQSLSLFVLYSKAKLKEVPLLLIKDSGKQNPPV